MSSLEPTGNQYPSAPFQDDEVDLKELFMVLWAGKWMIMAVAGLAAALSVVFALSLSNVYRASALLAPAESSGGGLTGLMKQYGGIASLAGVSIPSGNEGASAQLGMQLMKSRAFASDFIDRHDILPELMAVDSWDPGSGDLTYDPDVYDSSSGQWVREVEPPKNSEPSAQEAFKAFSAILDVSQDSKTGYITVSIEHKSPVVAAQWVRWLTIDVNAAVKAQDVAEAEKSIEYLKQQVAKTSLADLQVMFFKLIQSQTETVMLAEARPEYVFKTIDPAVIPEEKSKPSRGLIVSLATFIGILLGSLFVLVMHYARPGSNR